MRSVERAIEQAVSERMAPPPPQRRSLEDFAVQNMRSLAFGAAAGVAALAAFVLMDAPPAPATPADPVIVGSVRETPRLPGGPSWRAVQRPVEIVTLQAPQFARHAAQYAARASAAGDREDALIFEPNQPDLPEAKVALRRAAAEGAQPSLFIDMTRQQAERGVAVVRAGAPGRLATKFGEIEVADMTFQDHGGRAQSCLAFRSDGAIGIAGWLCAPQGAGVERPELACFVDRLSLLKAGEDAALKRFFAEAEGRRRPCPTTRVSTGRKPTWLDSDGKAPTMRGEITGSIAPRR